jgi:streptogramin lyase
LWQNGVSGSGLDQSDSIAVDSSSNIWVTNMAAAGNLTPGSITQLTASGAVLSGASGFTGGSINEPIAIAADAAGDVWIANLGQPEITVLSNGGTAVSGPSGYGVGVLTQPSAIAIDAAQNAWVADSANGNLVHMDNTGNILNTVSCCNNPDSVAIDSAGTIWIGDNTNSYLSAVTSAGVVAQSNLSGGGLNGPRTISIDGADHLWIANNSASTVSEFAGSNSSQAAATVLSPASGFGADVQMQQPYGVGVDPSGTVWITSFGDSRLIAFVGLGTPVRTPQIGPPQQP